MKKEELKRDPVAEKLLSVVEYSKNNSTKIIALIFVIALFVSGIGYYQNSQNQLVFESKLAVDEIMFAVAGATKIKSGHLANSMCPIFISSSRSSRLVLSEFPERYSTEAEVIKVIALSVATHFTCLPAFLNSRINSNDL